MSGRLGSMLVSSGLITDDQLKKALVCAEKRRRQARLYSCEA